MTWHARVSFVSEQFDEDAPLELSEALAQHAAVTSVARDMKGGAVALFVDAPSTLDAATTASELVSAAANDIVGKIDVTGLEVTNEDTFDAELARPVFPEVVGYAEISRMAGVTRQRARQFADITGFPSPVIVTEQGPLMSKHAVEAWLKRRPGRRSTELATA